MTWRRTNYSTDLSDAIDLIGHIGADGDGHVLLEGFTSMSQMGML
jgi:hypothetical protein